LRLLTNVLSLCGCVCAVCVRACPVNAEVMAICKRGGRVSATRPASTTAVPSCCMAMHSSTHPPAAEAPPHVNGTLLQKKLAPFQ